MRTEGAIRELIRVLLRKGASEDLIEAVVSLLDTDENLVKMTEVLNNMDTISETLILGKAILIADSDCV